MSAEVAIDTPAVTNPITPAAPATPPPASPPPAATPPAANPESKAPEADVVKLSLAEWQKTQARIAELDRLHAETERKRQEAEQRAFEAAAKEGNATKLAEIIEKREKAEVERRERENREQQAKWEAEQKRLADEYARLQNEARAKEQRAKQFAIDKAKGDALGKWADKLAPHAYQQLSKFWDGEFSAHEEGNSYSVRSSDGRTAEEFVNAALASDFYANFLKAGNPRGGTQIPGANPSAVTPQAPPAQQEQPLQFGTMGDALMYITKQNYSAGVNSATDMSKPMGLGRTTGLKLAQ